jgi:hypothetical protein
VVIKVECHPVGLTTLGRVCPRKAAAFQKSGNHGRRFVILSCLMPFKMDWSRMGQGAFVPEHRVVLVAVHLPNPGFLQVGGRKVF